jgi:hypothetical protein
LKQKLAVVVTLKDGMNIIEIDNSITRLAAIKERTLFAQELTPTGDILLRRLEAEKP